MTYLISRANYERCTEGMTGAQRAEFDRDFMRYPEHLDSPDGRINVDRVADDYARLRARETGMPAELTFQPVQPGPFAGWDLYGWVDETMAAWANCPRGNGKSSRRPPPSWEEIGDGMAAPGNPMFTADPGPAPTITELAEEDWRDLVTVDDLYSDNSARRYFLNDLVGEREQKPCSIGDVRASVRTFRERFIGPQRVVCGENALAAIQLAGRPTTVRASAGVVVDLAYTPIAADPDLPADVWQLVDAVTGEVLHEGIISQALSWLVQQMRDEARRMADLTDVPRGML